MPGTVSTPWSFPCSRMYSSAPCWSTKMFESSSPRSLRWKSSSSRKHGGPANGTKRDAPISVTKRAARASWLARFRRPRACFASSPSRYTIGYQIAPENCAMWRSYGPNASSASRSIGFESFWLNTVAVPSLTARPESPIAPSVGATERVGQEVETVDGDRLPVVRLEELAESEVHQGPAEIVGRKVGQDDHDVFANVVTEEASVEVVVVGMRDVEVSGRRRARRRRRPRCPGTGATTRRRRDGTTDRTRSRRGRCRCAHPRVRETSGASDGSRSPTPGRLPPCVAALPREMLPYAA